MSPENACLFEALRRKGPQWRATPPVHNVTLLKINGTLHHALRRARLNHAVNKPETLATLIMTALATAYLWLDEPGFAIPGWTWLVAPLVGLTAAILLIVITLTDADSIKEAVASALEDHFNIDSIADETIRAQIAQAVTHRASMAAVHAGSGAGTRHLASDVLAAVDQWLSGMGCLALRLEHFQAEFHLHSETRLLLLQRIHMLERRIGEVTDKRILNQLRETLAGRRHQLRAIEELGSLIERGLLRLEHAVAALGTVHAQLAMFMMHGDEQGDTAALTRDIDDEIREIDTVLTALDRVHDGGKSTGVDDVRYP